MDEVTVLKFQGRLDSNSAATVKDRIKSCINERRLQLVVDMGDVDFVDSSGLGSLVYSLRMIDKAGEPSGSPRCRIGCALFSS